jgi:hypothetical protein
MRDPKESAIELLQERGMRDAARVLERCKITLRQLDRRSERLGASLPLADVQIHAPKDLADCVLGSSMPEADWSNQIERALRDSAERDDLGVLVIQWVETEPSPPRVSEPRKSSGFTPGRQAGT